MNLYFRLFDDHIEFVDLDWNIKGSLDVDRNPIEKLHFTEREFYENVSLEIKKQLTKANNFLQNI